MSAQIVTTVLCCCSWRGKLPAKTSCPACGRAWHDRVTADKLALLREVRARADAPLTPTYRIRLREMGLIVLDGPPPEPSDTRRARPPRRRHRLTERGERVLAAADRVIAEQTRHDVAAAVARHAALEES